MYCIAKPCQGLQRALIHRLELSSVWYMAIPNVSGFDVVCFIQQALLGLGIVDLKCLSTTHMYHLGIPHPLDACKPLHSLTAAAAIYIFSW